MLSKKKKNTHKRGKMLFLYPPVKSAQHICAGFLIYVILN